MNKISTLTRFLISVIVIAGCTENNAQQSIPQDCSSEWYKLVEQKVNSSDGQGHGPDVGSTEWRSVIEFRLGLRGNAEVPALESEQWCNYINDYLMNKKE